MEPNLQLSTPNQLQSILAAKMYETEGINKSQNTKYVTRRKRYMVTISS
jgi:hypothetical protein